MIAILAAIVFALAFLLQLFGTDTGKVSPAVPGPVPAGPALRLVAGRAVAAAAVSDFIWG
jgi:hypothetical protein